MIKWDIYYPDRMISGYTEEEWNAASDIGVQVLVYWKPYPSHISKWGHVINNRQLWTGDDEYSINGWKPKVGTLLPNEEYWKIWEEAAYGPNNILP